MRDLNSKVAVVDLPSFTGQFGAWQYGAVRTRHLNQTKRFIASISQTEKYVNRSMITYLSDPTSIKTSGKILPI